MSAQHDGEVMTVDDRAERYADVLINKAMLIVGAVHSDGPDVIRSTIRDALSLPAPPDREPVEALVVALAAMVSPDRSARQLLAWVQPADEYERLRRVGVSEETAAVLAYHRREAAA